MRKMYLFFVSAFLLGGIEMLYFYPLLPDRMAVHFNAAGAADGWGPKNYFFMTMEAVYAVLLLLFGALPLLLRRLPESLMNLPNKDYWLAPERKAQTMDRLMGQLLFVGAMALLLMDCVLYLSLKANFSARPFLRPELLWGIITVFFIASIAWTIFLLRSFRLPKAP